MISIEEYIKNPCRVSALPYWKEKSFKTPESIMVIHNDDFSEDLLDSYADDPYFRLYHSMDNIIHYESDCFYIKTAKQEDEAIIVDIINNSYTDIQVTEEQIHSYTKTQVYNRNLWIIVYEKGTNKAAGCGIADYDKNVKEVILEWIQVLPQYRNRKLGSLIVYELLYRMKDVAEFATVSGRVENDSNPEGLYRKCGFTGDDVWHILQKKIVSE